MITTLILIFLFNGQEVRIERPIDMAACASQTTAQIQAAEVLHDHPKYVWDHRWSCRIGRMEKQA